MSVRLLVILVALSCCATLANSYGLDGEHGGKDDDPKMGDGSDENNQGDDVPDDGSDDDGDSDDKGDDVPDDGNDDDDDDKPDEVKKLFSKRWRSAYSAKQLRYHSPWVLDDDQPEDGSFEVRIYQKQWWVLAHTPCQSQNEASGSGYMDLYLFFNRMNFQKTKYPLTYPAVLEINKNPPKPKVALPVKRAQKKTPKRRGKKGGKRRKRKPQKPKVCPIRYTSCFYVVVRPKKYPATPIKKSITTIHMPSETYFVKEYFGNYTGEYCNEQAVELVTSLSKNNKWFDSKVWYCSRYEKAANEEKERYEVWFKEKTEE